MQGRNRRDEGQQEVMVIEKPEAIRLLFSEKHNRILMQLVREELSISDIARSLEYNPGSVHYHLKDLERHGLVRQVRQEIKGGIVKKYYRSVARHIWLKNLDFGDHQKSPDSGDAMQSGADMADDLNEKLLGTIERFGYAIKEEDRAEALEVLSGYDRRLKELTREMISPDVDIYGEDGMLFRHARQLIINMRTPDDPELCRISRQFSQLFIRIS